MQNKFTQYIPNYYSGYDEERIIFDFDDTDELLNNPFFKKMEQYPLFSHFALSEESIMMICNEGHYWRVVGSVQRPELIDIPQWENNKEFQQPKFEQPEYSYPMVIGDMVFKIYPKEDGRVNIKYGTIVDENDVLNFDKIINIQNIELSDINIKTISEIIENIKSHTK